ncbi:hypothetical protein KJ966_24710 [bacterium]|nr:hypothetical protein [bacterium]
MRTFVIDKAAVRQLLRNEWKDLVRDGFTQQALSELFDPESLGWNILENYHDDFYDLQRVYITAYRKALKEQITQIRQDYRRMMADLMEKYGRVSNQSTKTNTD